MFGQKRYKMVQEEKNIQIHVEGDLNAVGLDEASAEDISKRISLAIALQMTISENAEEK